MKPGERSMQSIQSDQVIGNQYSPDDGFKTAARLHQCKYRAEILNVDYVDYGNRLTVADGRKLLNYYEGLNVHEILRQRYPKYSNKRDADMLRSEHIPFNFFAPLVNRPALAEQVLNNIISKRFYSPLRLEFEWAPKPAENYLDDNTSFDTYIEARDEHGKLTGIGIEVKYTERGYPIGRTEKKRVNDSNSLYWKVTRNSKAFNNNDTEVLAQNNLRQIWRNHLLGLSMIQAGKIDQFVLITIYPSGNRYIAESISRYQDLLTNEAKIGCLGVTFEDYFAGIEGDSDILKWKEYLENRYIVKP